VKTRVSAVKKRIIKAGEDGVHIQVDWDEEIGAVIIDFGISGMCLPIDTAMQLANRIRDIWDELRHEGKL
jgi:hypothetical protein